MAPGGSARGATRDLLTRVARFRGAAIGCKIPPVSELPVHPDAVLSALVLAPTALSRNRFYALHDNPAMKRIRKRARRVRGVIRQLLGQGREKGVEVGRRVLDDDRVLLRFNVESLSYSRTVSLSALEASLVGYALYRAEGRQLDDEDKERVERALGRLSDGLGILLG